MDALAEQSWRIAPAIAMLAAGAVLAAHGLRREIGGLRAPFADRDKPLRMMTGFRAAIVGAALVLFGAAWLGQIAWLMWLAAIIGFGELLESSLMISGMRMGRRLEDEQRRRNQRA
jgi:hypothetical protein